MSLGRKFTVLRTYKKKSRAPTAGTRPGKWGGIEKKTGAFYRHLVETRWNREADDLVSSAPPLNFGLFLEYCFQEREREIRWNLVSWLPATAQPKTFWLKYFWHPWPLSRTELPTSLGAFLALGLVKTVYFQGSLPWNCPASFCHLFPSIITCLDLPVQFRMLGTW